MENKTQPRLIKKVVEQIIAHPEFYTKLNDGTRFAFSAGISGYTKQGAENNKWYREIWNLLYLGIPMSVH